MGTLCVTVTVSEAAGRDSFQTQCPRRSARSVAVDMSGWDMKETWLPLVSDDALMDDVAAVTFAHG